jgi:hypothetical protein
MSAVSHMALAGGSGIHDGNDAFTKILLHMDGANAGTTFTDSNLGGSAHTWTPTSVTTSTAQFKFGTASLTDAAGGSLKAPDSADFTLGSGDFTIDGWFYVSGGAGTTRALCGQTDAAASIASTSVIVTLLTTNLLRLNVGQAGVLTQVNSTTTFTTTGWHHFAAVRTGNVLKLFIDGVQEGGNVAFTGSVNDSAASFAVGGEGDFSGVFWNGFVEEFRLSVGIARWTANFTPPTAAYS